MPELWSAEEAAEYWGVSVSRARAILASRGIQRVSGYPAEQVKAVELRQGARTDLHPTTAAANDAGRKREEQLEPAPLSELAAEAADTLATLDLADERARTSLAGRLLASGVTPAMHADQLTSILPLLRTTSDMSVSEGASIATWNLDVLTERQQGVKTWPRDKQIEYKLGQLLPLLQHPIPELSDEVAARIRGDLVDLITEDPAAE